MKDEIDLNTTQVGQLLQSLKKGRLIDEVERKLQEVLEESAEHGGNGTLSINFKFKTEVKRGETLTEITADVKSRAPVEHQYPTVRFLSDKGVLCMDNPNQPELPGIGKVTPLVLGGEAAEPKEERKPRRVAGE